VIRHGFAPAHAPPACPLPPLSFAPPGDALPDKTDTRPTNIEYRARVGGAAPAGIEVDYGMSRGRVFGI